MGRILDRYVWQEISAPFGLGALLFTFFLLTDRIFDLIGLILSKGVPALMVGQLLVYLLPSFVGYTLPMAVLLAILVATSRLASDFEVVGFQASGLSPARLFRPFLLFGLAITIVTALLTLFAGPWGSGQFKQLVFRIIQTRAAVGIKERLFNSTFGQFVLYVEEVSASQVALRGLLVSDERDPKLSRIITAREGRLLTDEVNRRITLRLIDGAIHETGTDDLARYRRVSFGIYDINLSIDSPLTSQTQKEKPEQEMGLRELSREAGAARRERKNPSPFLVEYHKRFAIPMAALVLPLIAFPLGIRTRRGGKSVALALSLVILMTYYVTLTTGESLALSQRLPPWIAMWSPNLLALLLGVTLFYSILYREGRGWNELWWRALRFVLERRRAKAPTRERAAPHPERRQRNSSHLIDRYLIREFLTYVGYGLAVTTCLFVIADLFQDIDRYLRMKPSFTTILEHYLYRTPPALYQGLPIVVLLATILLFLTLMRQNELTALKAAGVSLYRVSAPILLLALGFSLAGFLFQETLLPVLNQKGEEVDKIKIRQIVPRYLQKRTQFWIRSSDTRFFHMDLLDPGSQAIEGITVLEVDRNFQVTNRLDARTARWSPQGWEFRQGIHREFEAKDTIQEIPFTVTTLALKEEIRNFLEIQKPPEIMSSRELRAYVNRLEETGHRVEKYLVELYSKLAFPLIYVIMAVVGIPFALQSPRGGRLIGIGLAILLALSYWVIHSVAISLAKVGLLPPLLSAWAANVIFAGLGFALFFQTRT